MKKILNKQLAKKIIFFSLLLVFFLFISKAYYQRFAAFGCFDECFNYTAGYFMLKGRVLYESIYFNHQPLMAYLSYFIQLISRPASVYHLVLYHKMFVLIFAILMDIVLIIRFRFIGAGFVLFYEATKFYLMGNLFIPESLIVYPLAYMMGVILFKFSARKTFPIDIIMSGIFAWFVVFMREPYIILAIIMYGLILFNRKMSYPKLISFILFLLLTLLVLGSLNLKEYIFQVVENNFHGVFRSEVENNQILGMGIYKVFLYPFLIFIEGQWTFLRTILFGLDIIFLGSILILFIKTKKILIPIIIFLILGFSNLRATVPGKMFYESFHMLSWYGLFLISTLFLSYELYYWEKTKKIGSVLIFFVCMLFSYSIFSPNSFLKENFNSEKEYLRNFAQYYVFGEAVRLLSKPGDTIFINRENDLIYWQTKLDSAYKYAIFYGNGIKKFEVARNEMFQNNPPDFYYYYLCSGKKSGSPQIPDFKKEEYVALNYIDKSCLYVKKSKISSVSQDTWDKLKVLRFYL
ncbi:MAG: hypothetical protein ABH816_02615 [Candidatus Levyibacteriota bacterium]